MTAKIIFIFLIILIMTGCSQTEKSSYYRYYKTPKGMTFIPPGEITLKNDTIDKTYSINAFWMSEEITNKEFREFVNDLKENQDSSVFGVDLPQAANKNLVDNNSNSLNNKVSNKKKKNAYYKRTYAEMLEDVIDFSVWDNVDEFKNYFYDKKFDNYPVVGITYRAAINYCLWKSKTDRQTGIVTNFRLPLEIEWEYAALGGAEVFMETEDNFELSKVNRGKKNGFGLKHINSNVSEFVNSSACQDCVIIKGSSWKEKQDLNSRIIKPDDFRDNATGFRIVMTFLGHL